MNLQTKVEILADYAHRSWTGWMVYLFRKSVRNDDGSVTIPKELVERWNYQIKTSYDRLSQKEQDSDRKEAIEMLSIILKD